MLTRKSKSVAGIGENGACRIPADVRERNPLITRAGMRMLDRLQQHPDAPRWNHLAGDRIGRKDLKAVRQFAERLQSGRSAAQNPDPPPAILERVSRLRAAVPWYEECLPADGRLEAEWGGLPTMSREDIVLRVDRLVPLDADLDRMIVYRTAGTTGHPILVPHDPRAAACYQPLLDFALSRYNALPDYGSGMVACFLVGAQVRTVTYPTVMSFWKCAGFAKLNINPAEWPTPESAHRYFTDLSPAFLTGDPISFAEMMRLQIQVQPKAMITTAVAMSTGLKKRLEKFYACPVIDWYSLTETGPIGYACPLGHGYHVLPTDIYVEAVDADGCPVAPGERGEITVTGGRNPFLPLLRYRTGDWGRLDFGDCECGDPMPRIIDLEGRPPVLFRAADGSTVNTVDISRVLREYAFVQHEFTQHHDLSCELVARPVSSHESINTDALRKDLARLFGDSVGIVIRFDDALGNRQEGGKTTPYRSKLLLED